MRQMHNAVPGLQAVCTCGHVWRDVCAADHARANKRGQYARLMRNATKLDTVKSPFNYDLFVLIRPIGFNRTNDRDENFSRRYLLCYFLPFFLFLFLFFYFISNFSLIPSISRKNYTFVLLTGLTNR